MIRMRYSGVAFKGLLAEFMASTKKYPLGDVLMPTDSEEIRIANGLDVFADLISIPAQARVKAAKITALGATANLTAIGGVFADLAAARTGVNQLRTDAEARLDAIETKIDALLGAMTTANLMSAT